MIGWAVDRSMFVYEWGIHIACGSILRSSVERDQPESNLEEAHENGPETAP